ncbi:TSC22 domain family protein 2-like isoform X2 [Alosa sapidissima]|uniref:TSC22 domain family protein 2-like isoform X2 n=1 Tax=Alosa sapidissima TaxID=34773 RepID=UPI001C084B85|nr:TSC22 domain family protein 2-like isoform X2 [Alosa sapidissima]
MSKMPAKKKSCFQITSVTQAQVAANSVADDTESLDDPDESRTEDVSSEIFDVSRTDFEPEVCDRSSSEETLNHVGETDAAHTHAARPLPSTTGTFNISPSFRNIIPNSVTNVSHQSPITGVSTVQNSVPTSGVVHQLAPSVGAGIVSGSTTPLASTGSVSASTTTTTTTTTSCSSRFRVIKLDHGTGEPFRRGRWTCTEFYEKDSEGSVISRNVDTIRHNSTLDPGTDRDSGLGATGGSSVAPSGLSGHGPDPSAETALSAASHVIHSDLQQQQNYGVSQHHVISGSVTHEMQQMQCSPHPVQQQNLLMTGLNGSQQTMHIQKSPGVPPGPQAQPVIYQTQPLQQPVPPQQLQLGHQLPAQPSLLPGSQLEYSQQHLAVTTVQSNSTANLSIGRAVNQGPSPIPTPASGVQGLGMSGEMPGVLGGVPISQPVPQSTSAHLQQPTGGMGSAGGPMMAVGALQQQQQQPQIGQYLSSGVPHGLPNAQNVPTAPTSVAISSAPSSSIPTSVPVASSMVTQNTTLPSAAGQQQQPQMPRNGTAGVMGTSNHPTASLGQTDENRRKSDVISQFPAVSGKDLPIKPLIPESLQLAHPAVNSLFGIPIQIDGDEDSASGASVVAIDNKIEQAMDLVKSHLMYAVREEVEVLKEQIKELYERNSVLERENAVLKSLANSDQLSQLSVQPATATSNSTPPQLTGGQAPGTKVHSQPAHPMEVGKPITTPPLQPNVTSA